MPFDPWRVLDAVSRRAPWVAILALVLGGALIAVLPKTTEYSAVVRFVPREAPLGLPQDRAVPASRAATLPPATAAALAAAWTHPEVVAGVAEKLKPSTTPDDVADGIEAVKVETTDPNPEIIKIKITSKVGREHCASMANLYSKEVVAYTKTLQAREAHEMAGFFQVALGSLDTELDQANGEIKKFLQDANLFDYDKETDAFLAHRGQLDRDFHNARIEADTVDLKIKSLVDQILELKQGELESLLIRYSEAHPLVEERKAMLEVLKRQLNNISSKSILDVDAGSPVASGLFMQIINLRVSKIALAKQVEELGQVRDRVTEKLTGMSRTGMEYGKLKARVQSLQVSRSLLANRLRDAQLAENNAVGFVRGLSNVTAAGVGSIPGWFMPGVVGAIAAGVILLLGLGFIAGREILDDRIISPSDLRRATGLQVVASLPVLDGFDEAGRQDQGFRAWTVLSGTLSQSGSELLVAGFASSRNGEGLTTWISCLAAAARRRGVPVAVLSTIPASAAQSASPRPSPSGGTTSSEPRWMEDAFASGLTLSQTSSVLAPPSGWSWTPDHLESWKRLMERFSRLERGVVLVELPPMHLPEAVVLAEAMPRLVWLASSRSALVSETRAIMDILRFTRCRFAGAVLNRASEVSVRRWFSRWLPMAAALLMGSWTLAGSAQTNEPASRPGASVVSTNQFLSVTSQSQRAPWQQKLTLGPGDVLSIGLYGESTLGRSDVVVGPDGRLSYLQATDVMASGLSIDELRTAIQDKLRAYYRSPRVLISPGGFRSKKFFMLGAVNEKGVFTLDRPMTLVEAVARAKGVSSAFLTDNQIVDLADFSRSFLIRGGEHVSLDFEKLFQEGDLTQNIALAPNDFLYFAPASRDEVYVLGAVGSAGVTPFTPKLTLLSAVASRGGFGGGAYLSKVLVVRGSLRRPETFVLNATEILKGKTPDFRLQRKDIIYVSSSPYAFVGQVLNLAIQSYTYGVVVSWTGENVTKKVIDTKPYIKGL